MTFEELRAANRLRCERDFQRVVDVNLVPSMTLGLTEEAGEVAGAVRALLGMSGRKLPSLEAVADEISDVVAYADLLATSLGLRLEDIVAAKFNRVSERIGSTVRLPEVQR